MRYMGTYYKISYYFFLFLYFLWLHSARWSESSYVTDAAKRRGGFDHSHSTETSLLSLQPGDLHFYYLFYFADQKTHLST